MAALPRQSLDDRFAFVGTAGSGKTYGAGTAVETLFALNRRVVIIDPLDVWWGLRLDSDGKTPSSCRPVIFGGRHGDMPLTERAGELLGEVAATSTESMILSLSDIGTRAGERRFVLAFLTALYRKASNEPVHLVFDEADMWAPQRILDKEGDAMKLLGIMETIVRRGRIKGFLPWLITQRPAVLSKNVLSQADGLVAFKLTSKQDRDAIGDWVEGQADKEQWKKLFGDLATLPRGRALIWIPGRQILETKQFPLKVTFDSSKTPGRGDTRVTADLQKLDMEALRGRLAAVEAEAKENDPKALKAEITRLKSESRKHIVTDPQAIDAAQQRGYQDGYAQGHQHGYSKGFSAALTAAKRAVDDVEHQSDAGAAPAPLQPRQAVFVKTTAPATVRAENDLENKLSPSARLIVSAIHKAYPVGLTFDAAARRAGISKRSSAYRNYRKEVESCAEVEKDGDKFCSRPGYGDSTPITPGASVDVWVKRLPPSYGKMLLAIAEGHETRDAIAEASGVSPTSSGLGAGLRELVDLELVVADGGAYSLAEGM